MRVLSNAIRSMYVEFPRSRRRTINDAGPFAVPVTRGRLSHSRELVEGLLLKAQTIILDVGPVIRLLYKIPVLATPLRIPYADGVAFRARKLVDLLDNVLVAGRIIFPYNTCLADLLR
jgi:hypothetical protein